VVHFTASSQRAAILLYLYFWVVILRLINIFLYYDTSVQLFMSTLILILELLVVPYSLDASNSDLVGVFAMVSASYARQHG